MITKLSLSNFRSYSHLELNLTPNINVIIGKNGHGKTNILEAIYFISNIRSHRTRNDLSMIKHDSEYARIIIESQKNDKHNKIMSVIHSKGKYFSINNQSIKKTSEMLGMINTVLFYPTETTLFSDSPSVRRNFFDVEIGKVSQIYTYNFQTFNRLLKDRNQMLKREALDDILFEMITSEMIDVQIEISKRRFILIQYINQNIQAVLDKLLTQSIPINIQYKSTVVNQDRDALKISYQKCKQRDIQLKATQDGIHRDDYLILSDDIEVSKVLSQGQIRMVLLAIKLVIVDFIYEKSGIKPILLLDDVMSELDADNQINLINAIQDVQTIITTTETLNIFEKQNVNNIHIVNSHIRNEEA
ncbi:MAG: DNA replication/repair protein RecF [Erysipelothrix sp.]|nr:DNA replication/repair protein RecF [Erysipelothrix sp.]